MDEKTMEELKEAHRKAMEGIAEFVRWMRDVTEICNDYLGYNEDK